MWERRDGQKQRKSFFKNDPDLWFVVVPVLGEAQQQQQPASGAVKCQDDSTGAGICWVRRGRGHAWGTRLLEVMSWPGDNPLSTLLLAFLAAHWAAAPPWRLLEGHWGTPELSSPSSESPFVPKQVSLDEAPSSCSLLLCLFNLMPFKLNFI